MPMDGQRKNETRRQREWQDANVLPLKRRRVQEYLLNVQTIACVPQ